MTEPLVNMILFSMYLIGTADIIGTTLNLLELDSQINGISQFHLGPYDIERMRQEMSKEKLRLATSVIVLVEIAAISTKLN